MDKIGLEEWFYRGYAYHVEELWAGNIQVRHLQASEARQHLTHSHSWTDVQQLCKVLQKQVKQTNKQINKIINIPSLPEARSKRWEHGLAAGRLQYCDVTNEYRSRFSM